MLKPEVLAKVLNDLAAGNPPDKTYTPEMVAFYKDAAAEHAEWCKTHPGAVVSVPNELPDESIKVPLEYSK